MTIQDFNIGDRVKVSNGQKKPPARFNRKLAAWECRNYTGTVADIEAARNYQPSGALLITPDGRSIAGCIEIRNHVRIGSAIIEKIEG